MRRIIKLMPEYGGTVLWKAGASDVGAIDPDDLPLSHELKKMLRSWGSEYDATLNDEYPPDSGFPTRAAEEAFYAEGERLRGLMQAELGVEYEIIYRNNAK